MLAPGFKQYEWRVSVDKVGTIGSVFTTTDNLSSARHLALSRFGEEGRRPKRTDPSTRSCIYEDDEFDVIPV